MFNPYMSAFGQSIPVFDCPDIGKRVYKPLHPNNVPNLICVSEYTGNILDSLPTKKTRTDAPHGFNEYYTVGNVGWSETLNQKVIFCHQQGHNSSQNVYRDSTGRRQRY
jgi:hypothetical protein